MNKKLLIVFFLLCLIFLVGCVSNPPSERVIKEHLVGKKFYLSGGPLLGGEAYEIKSTDNIKGFSIEKRQTDKREKKDNPFVNIRIVDDEFTYEGTLNLSYNYYDKGGWILDEVKRATEEPFTRTINKKLNDEEIKELLAGQRIDIDKSRGNRIIGSNDIKHFNIKNRETDLIKGNESIIADIVIETSYERISGEALMRLKYFSSSGNRWRISSLGNAPDKPFAIELLGGQNEGLIKDSFVGKRIRNIYSINGTEFIWDVEEGDIQDLIIREQNTNLNDKTDEVICDIKLAKDNGICSGKIKANYKYNEKNGWQLQEIQREGEPFTREHPVEPLEDTKIKELIKDHIEEKGTVNVTWFRWYEVEPEDIQDIAINQRYLTKYGTEDSIKADIVLKDKTIENASFSFYLVNGTWQSRPE